VSIDLSWFPRLATEDPAFRAALVPAVRVFEPSFAALLPSLIDFFTAFSPNDSTELNFGEVDCRERDLPESSRDGAPEDGEPLPDPELSPSPLVAPSRDGVFTGGTGGVFDIFYPVPRSEQINT
tara:strand:- start:2260 stop:2631 length:372 start_codon:yes stop_codon:yes gene_type:complete